MGVRSEKREREKKEPTHTSAREKGVKRNSTGIQMRAHTHTEGKKRVSTASMNHKKNQHQLKKVHRKKKQYCVIK